MKKTSKKRTSKTQPKAELPDEQLDRVAGGVTSAMSTSAITSTGSGGDAPTETFSLDFAEMGIQYTQQKPDGSGRRK